MNEKHENVPLPPNRAVLWMEYSYDLYPLTNESWAIPVQHALDYEVFDKDLDIPRFEVLKITRELSQWETQAKTIQGDELKALVDKSGTLKLDLQKLKEIDLPSPTENS